MTSRRCAHRSSTPSRRASTRCCAPRRAEGRSSSAFRQALLLLAGGYFFFSRFLSPRCRSRATVLAARAAPAAAPTAFPSFLPFSAVCPSSSRSVATALVSSRRSSAMSCLSFDSVAIADRLGRESSLLDRLLRYRLRALLQHHQPDGAEHSCDEEETAEHDQQREPD